MLRTNQAFLTYAEALYAEQQHPGNVTLKHFSRGQKLFSQKEPASKVMLIKEGITKCYFNEENDKDYILEFLGKGEIIGEIECIRRIPSLCNVEAMTEVQALAFSNPYFRDLLGKDLKLNSLLLDAFAERIVNTASRASFQQLYTVDVFTRL